MQPDEDLKNLVLRHYGKFASQEQAGSIHDMYSLEEGVVLIGTKRDEWVADRESIQAAIKAGSGDQMKIDVQDIEARSEGSVGWTMDRVLVTLPDGNVTPLRHTRIFHREVGKWRLVHLHVSTVAPDKSI